MIGVTLLDFEAETSSDVPFDSEERVHCVLVFDDLIEKLSLLEDLLVLQTHFLILIREFEFPVLNGHHAFEDLCDRGTSLLECRLEVDLDLLVSLADTNASSEVAEVDPLRPLCLLVDQLLDYELIVLVVKL